MRIGHGFDVHRLETGRTLVIGGVAIPYHKGFVAHSDGDVLIHALCDALLGAAALGDIGQHFPPEDPSYRNIDSRVLLRNVVELLGTRSLMACSVDITVAAEAPKLAPHIPAMKKNLAADLDIGADILNIKATTTEGLGFTGRGEGIAAWAVVLLDDKR